MTPERRAELKRLCEAATKGPWTLGDENNEGCEVLTGEARVSLDRYGNNCGTCGEMVIEREQMLANAHFIMEAREAVPELLEVASEMAIMSEAVDAAIADRKAVESERDALKAEVERLKGMKPELPPRPPDGSGLPRYGLRWNGALPLPVPMPDGFWTPWHLALARVAEMEGALRATTEGRDRFAERVRSMESALQTAVSCFDIRLLVTAEQWTAMEAKCRAALVGKEATPVCTTCGGGGWRVLDPAEFGEPCPVCRAGKEGG